MAIDLYKAFYENCRLGYLVFTRFELRVYVYVSVCVGGGVFF